MTSQSTKGYSEPTASAGNVKNSVRFHETGQILQSSSNGFNSLTQVAPDAVPYVWVKRLQMISPIGSDSREESSCATGDTVAPVRGEVRS